MKQFKLQGPRVTLSNELKPEYAEELAEQANSLRISENIGGHSFPYPYTAEDALFFLEKNREEGKSFFQIDFIIWIGGSIGGVVGLGEIDRTDGKAHVGYWLGEKYWNRGYATEALSLISEFAEKELKLVRIYSKILDYNLASLRVQLKNGFKVEGYERMAFKMKDGYHSFFLTAKLFKEQPS